MRSLIVVVMVIIFVACDSIDEITPQKYAELIIWQMAPIKTEIEKSLITKPGESVPQAGSLKLLPLPGGIDPMKFNFGWITKNGAIIVQSKKYDVVIVQEPILVNGKFVWSCIVNPKEINPIPCRLNLGMQRPHAPAFEEVSN